MQCLQAYDSSWVMHQIHSHHLNYVIFELGVHTNSLCMKILKQTNYMSILLAVLHLCH